MSVKLEEVGFTPNILQPRYVNQESPVSFPTPSQMMDNEPKQLLMIKIQEPFEIDKEYLRRGKTIKT